VVVLLPPGGQELHSQPRRVLSGIAVGVVLLAALFTGLTPVLEGGLRLPGVASNQLITFGSVAGVGHQLFDYNKLLIGFELTAPLLLVAIIGSVALWRRQGAPS